MVFLILSLFIITFASPYDDIHEPEIYIRAYGPDQHRRYISPAPPFCYIPKDNTGKVRRPPKQQFEGWDAIDKMCPFIDFIFTNSFKPVSRITAMRALADGLLPEQDWWTCVSSDFDKVCTCT